MMSEEDRARSYDRQYHEAREITLKRDNYTCVNCGETYPETQLQTHHLDYTRNEPNNLITLCASCHRKKHPVNQTRKKLPKPMMRTITVKDETHTRIRKNGISGESMDLIINKALDALEKRGN